jgi:hypothetical protein
MSKEEVYDAEIASLMAKIIEICRVHEIALLADFAIGTESDPGLKCTTALLDVAFNPPEEMLQALAILKPKKSSTIMLTETKADGSKTVMAILAR